MAIFDTDLDYTKLIQFTEGTLQLASFVQIRNALIQRMKDIYGNDIDVSPASADGQYINSIALLVNNIMQTLKKGNESLDPSVATGRYLDTLCSFNNITRIRPSASTAELYVYYKANAMVPPLKVNKLTFIDRNNTLWLWDNGGFDIEILPNTPYLLTDLECEELGPISAPGNNAFYKYDEDTGEFVEVDTPEEQSWDNPDLYSSENNNSTIYQCVSTGLYVWQYKDAIVGDQEETDEALRSRRYQMLGNNSVTVLEGLKSNLLNLSAITDAYIFNNTSSVDYDVVLDSPTFEPIADGTPLKAHSIYVALRYADGVSIEEREIGKLIYDKLTPGISTSVSDGDSDTVFDVLQTAPGDWDSLKEAVYKEYSQNQSSSWPPAAPVYKLAVRRELRPGGGTRTIHLRLTLVEEEPDDWSTDYEDYYVLTSVSSSADWEQNKYCRASSMRSLEIVRTSQFSDFVYWKKCGSIHPPIYLTFQTNPSLYDYPADLSSLNEDHTDIEKNIIKELQKTISSAKISEYLSISGLLTTLQQADLKKNGMSTFFAMSGYFDNDNGMTLYPANLSYFKYDEADYHFSYATSNGLPTGAAELFIYKE